MRRRYVRLAAACACAVAAAMFPTAALAGGGGDGNGGGGGEDQHYSQSQAPSENGSGSSDTSSASYDSKSSKQSDGSHGEQAAKAELGQPSDKSQTPDKKRCKGKQAQEAPQSGVQGVAYTQHQSDDAKQTEAKPAESKPAESSAPHTKKPEATAQDEHDFTKAVPSTVVEKKFCGSTVQAAGTNQYGQYEGQHVDTADALVVSKDCAPASETQQVKQTEQQQQSQAVAQAVAPMAVPATQPLNVGPLNVAATTAGAASPTTQSTAPTAHRPQAQGSVLGVHTTLAKPKPQAGTLGAVGRVAGATLPFTGFPVWLVVVLAFALILAGLALRRRGTGGAQL